MTLIVAVAAEVMKHDARSAWGWVTYYSGLETFRLSCYEPVKPGPRPKTPEPGTPPPPPDPGPSTPGSGGGGSSTSK